jgi:hypothetical protein
LLEAWDTGRGLGGVLGLVTEVEGPWTDERPDRITRAELDARFGAAPDDDAVAEAVELGVLERIEGDPDTFAVPSPQELSVAVELHAAGVPLSAISDHLRELRGQVEHIAARFLEFTTEYVFARYLDDPGRRTDARAAEAASLVRRLRPLAQQTMEAELARAMRTLATRQLRTHLVAEKPAQETSDARSVPLPTETISAVERLVGPAHAAEFIALAAERELRGRALDRLASASPVDKELREPS